MLISGHCVRKNFYNSLADGLNGDNNYLGPNVTSELKGYPELACVCYKHFEGFNLQSYICPLRRAHGHPI